MHKYALTGCRSKPLASYLKAVAVLRLVSEQTDSQAKGWWEGDRFFFRSKLDENALAAFFCDEYSPTPVVAPWNGGSGFYLGDATKGMDAIESSKQSRFAGYRDVISAIKAWPEIPSFDTVDDVRQMLRVTREGMQQGNKRDEIDTLLDDVSSPGIDTSGLKEQDLVQLSLSEVEALSQQQGNADYLALSGFANELNG